MQSPSKTVGSFRRSLGKMHLKEYVADPSANYALSLLSNRDLLKDYGASETVTSRSFIYDSCLVVNGMPRQDTVREIARIGA